MLFALPRESRSSEMWVGMNRKPEKNIPDIIDSNFKSLADFFIILTKIFSSELTIKYLF